MAAWTNTARSLGETHVRQVASGLVERVTEARNKLGGSRARFAFDESMDTEDDRGEPLGSALRLLREELMSCAAAIDDDLVAAAVHWPSLDLGTSPPLPADFD
jgi:hypothetical protein